MTSPHRRRSAAPHLNDSRTEDWRARRRELERITVDYANGHRSLPGRDRVADE